MDKNYLFNQLEGGLIVSCQALEHEPMYSKEGGVMPLFAKAAKEAGAVGIRANGVRDIKEIKEEVDLPIIGIIKKDYENTQAYITPSMEEVDSLVEVGCDIIATDFTTQSRVNGLSATEFVKNIKEKYPNQLIMADCATLEDAINADKAGVDFIGTTLSGYTDDSKDQKTTGPNIELVKQISQNCKTKIIGEGRIHYPKQAKEVLDAGAFCVVVGGAITRPLEIAKRFIEEINK